MESDYSDDDDYLPITAGAWGDQARQENQDDNGNTETTQRDPTKTDTDGWSGLIDPEAKKMAGALGSGGLHRQGKNYKPLSEEYIIKQRKGVVIPKSKDTKKTRAPRSGSKQTTPTPSTSHRNFNHPTKPKPSTTPATTTSSSKPKRQPTIPTRPPPPPSTIRRPPPPSSSGQTGWGAQPLVETPFWENKDNALPTPPPSQTSQRQNEINQWGSWGSPSGNGNTERPSARITTTTTTTLSPPPGFGPVPQRQYPVKSNSKSQPRPPPGFSYSEKSAWGTSSPQSSENNNSNAQLHSWTMNDDDKELWRRMEEGARTIKKTTNNYESNGTYSNNNNKNSDLDWVSGWDDLSLNNKKAASTSTTSQGNNGRTATTTSPTTHTGNWGSTPTMNDTGGWNSAPTTNDTGSWGSTRITTDTGGWGTTSPSINNNSGNNNNNNNGDKWGSTAAMDTTTQLEHDDITSPMQFLDQQMAGYNKGRFSDPSKNKYSSTMTAMDRDTGNKHLPKNYYTRNGTSRPAFMDAPHRVAQPPPSHNPVVISIHLELGNGSKVPVPIRKLDSPQALGQAFCRSQNITNPALINGISDLFAQQKSTAMQRYNRS